MANWRIERIRNFLIRKTEEACFLSKIKANNNDILLVKLDKLGDYILFRNFIEEAHRQYHSSGNLVLCGNIAWKELAQKLDGAFVGKFIWVDPNRLQDNFYRFSVYRKIRMVKCGKVINCSYSRTELGDKIALHSGAKETIAFYGDETNIPTIVKKVNDTRYTLLVPSPEKCMFEFHRNKLFFEYLFKTTMQLDKPYVKINQQRSDEFKHIVIFPGAGHDTRRWSASNFAKLCAFLFEQYKIPILLCGAKDEMPYAEEIIALSGSYMTNCMGKYSLYETIGIIQNATLAVTNDSGPLHMAMAVMTPTICISNGNHFERFCPYPKDMNMPLTVVLPDEFEMKIEAEESRNSLQCRGSEININAITPEKVLHALKSGNLIKHD
jgi:ADP-heptose:LPS heptosyltransferase